MLGWGRDPGSTLVGPDERVLWSGRPVQGRRLERKDLMLIPFSLLWCGFAVFWTYSAWREGAPAFMLAAGAGFVMVGLWLVFGRFGHEARKRARLRYLVTDRRVIVAREGLRPAMRSIDLDRLPELSLSENGDGTGTIRFERPEPSEALWRQSIDQRGQVVHQRMLSARRLRRARAGIGMAFRDIEDVARVHALVRDAAQAARPTARG